jgi:hypothetical protein
MNQKPPKPNEKTKEPRLIPVASAVFDDGAILEMVLRPEERRTVFVLWNDGGWKVSDSVSRDPSRRLVPYSANNNLISNEVVLLPSGPEEYGTEAELVAGIQSFLHRYVDVSPLFEKIAAYYVLFTWVYDGFNELPYLRLRGDPGSGKTRFLLTVGSICYKPIFASGASTVSPIFRILDAFRGTLIIDEGDFKLSDERAEIIKILNNGNARGFPVLRSEVVGNRKEYNPHAYHVFGPKIVATRGSFEDRALESRCLTEEMGQSRLRDDIPINLPAAHKDEALQLRNKLLLFRFRNLHKRKPSEEMVDRTIEPRLNQIFVPLLSIIEDSQARAELWELARRYHREMVAERGLDAEAQVLEIIRDMLASPYDSRLAVKDITSWFVDRHGQDYERKITTKWIGWLIRKRLGLKTQRTDQGYLISFMETERLQRLYDHYGIAPVAADRPEAPRPEDACDAPRLNFGN